MGNYKALEEGKFKIRVTKLNPNDAFESHESLEAYPKFT
jgi:hypothetical protein